MALKIIAALRAYLARRRYRRFARAGYRLVKISYPNRIGHLCVEIDALLKDMMMRGFNTKKLILIDLKDGFANRQMVDYYRPLMTVKETHPLVGLIEKYGDPDGVLLETHPYAEAMYRTAKAYEMHAKWVPRPPLFRLLDGDRRALKSYLVQVGIPEDGWYVCLHAREGGYSPGDEWAHSYRSIDIHGFSMAIDEIIRRGGWCIRMGDATMRPYAPHPQVIDYAVSQAKTEQLDIALLAGSRFFLGSASGLSNVAEVFGRPCATAHMAPLACAYLLTPMGLSIFQKLRDRNGRLLPIAEIMMGDAANYRLTTDFTAAGLQNIPNTPEEIRELVIEMLERLDGTVNYSALDEQLQAKFKSYFREGHYCYHAVSRIGRDFLNRQMLLQD